MTEVADRAVEGRAAVAERRWADARALFEAADAEGTIDAEGLELLAWTYMWTGEPASALAVFERAYRGHVDAGNKRRAAFVAVQLAHEYGSNRYDRSTGNGWLGRAVELLDGEPEGPEHGYLELERGLIAYAKNDWDAVLALGREAERIGREHRDRALELRGRQRQGVALVARGDVDEGKALLDSVAVEAFAADLDPFSTLTLYCNAIGTCRDVAAFQDAAVLTQKATEFCEANSVAAFPGLCRVNRAEVKRIAGRFDEAEAEARRAADELRPWAPRFAAAAQYEIGEVRLRLGDLARAEEAFDTADDLGRDPEPGRSRLLLARGKPQPAFASIRRALADDSLGLPVRARLLPAFVEIALAAGEVERAREAAEELAAIAGKFETYPTALRAAAQQAEGAIRLAEGDADGAVTPLRRALRSWQESGARYEAARVRALLGVAYREGGDEEGAMAELAKAGSDFDRLGARLDAARVDELLGSQRGDRVTKTFVFTDIVDSTKVLEALGDVQWQKLLRGHDEVVREAAARHGGDVVDHTGDGFFLAFERPGDAVAAMAEVQRAVDRELPVEVRIGLHAAEATEIGDNYRGKGVHTAARVGAAARGGEILTSRETAELLDGARLGEPRVAELKGLSEPVELVPVEWR